MARSFFPDLGVPSPERAWPAASPADGTTTVPRVAWLATALIAGLACMLAAVFAGLWWRGEVQAESVSVALGRMSAEAARLTDEPSRQRRVFVSTKLDNTALITGLTTETTRLRLALETALTESAVSEKARRSAVDQLEQQAAGVRRQAAFLQQEQFRAATLEQNLTLTQTDLTQRAAEHDQHVDALQAHLISLRGTVTEREIEVRNITSTATQEIDRTRLAAQEVAQEAEWLAAQLRTVCEERDQLRGEVVRLQQCLETERAANHILNQRISQLECRIQELERRPPPAPVASPEALPGGAFHHGPPGSRAGHSR